jgi:hypothetical protein
LDRADAADAGAGGDRKAVRARGRRPESLPFGGATLPGYFLKPDASGTPRPTLLMIGSSDTVVEDLYA